MTNRNNQIKKFAQIIHQYVFPERKDVDKVESIVESLQLLGIEVYESKMSELNISGYVTRAPSSGKPMIVVNSEDNVNRQRFTMAHELGHLLLHFNWLPNTPLNLGAGNNIAYRHELEIYSSSEKVQEYEANMFAGELLMPFTKFKKMLDESRTDVEIANYFGVSTSAVYVRKKTISTFDHS